MHREDKSEKSTVTQYPYSYVTETMIKSTYKGRDSLHIPYF